MEMTACQHLADETFLDYIDFEKKRDVPRPISPCWERKPVKMDGFRRNGQAKLFSKFLLSGGTVELGVARTWYYRNRISPLEGANMVLS